MNFYLIPSITPTIRMKNRNIYAKIFRGGTSCHSTGDNQLKRYLYRYVMHIFTTRQKETFQCLFYVFLAYI